MARIVLVVSVLTGLAFAAAGIFNGGDQEQMYGGVIVAVFSAAIAIVARNAEVALRERRARATPEILSAVDAGETVVLRSRRWPAALSLVICVAIGSLFFVGAVEDRHPVPIIGAVLCAVGAAYSAWALLPGAEYLRLSPAGLVLKTPLRRTEYAWAEVDDFRTVYGEHGGRFAAGKRVVFRHGISGELPLPDDFGMDPDQLASALEQLRVRYTSRS